VTTCEDVRPLLPDHALGSLEGDEEDVLRHHLRGCGACRRELEALREGFGIFTSALERPTPPPLRDRVFGVLEEEWRDADGRQTTARGSWGRFAVAASILLAAIAGAFGVAQLFRANDVADDAASYNEVLATLGGTGFLVGSLEQAGDTPVEGSVVAYESSHDQSFVVVFVRTPEVQGSGELLVSRADGTSWDPGPIEFDGDGDAAVWWVTDRSITSMRGLTVRAPDGSLLATASLREA
jgi:anti-sigma factor RsiW